VFRRKIDPIVNGITDMQKFSPVTEIKSKKPTVTMLSHVWFAKDIKTALLAADIIVNQWKFKEYHLDIYGALNKAPIYSSECQEIIATKGLAPNVTLRGSGDPEMVLSKTWLFLNSSVSEGLPLALGEAALTGAPVVCTDVGASLRVLTHPESNERYSEIVAPNDPTSLARAQINLLAMLGQWAKYAEDTPGMPAPVLPIVPTERDVDIITRRMYEKSNQRRALGMMARTIVQSSFSGERYLREHEQMLWVGKSRYDSYGVGPDEEEAAVLPQAQQFNAAALLGGVNAQLEKMAHPRSQWIGRHEQQKTAATSFTSANTDYLSEFSHPPNTTTRNGPPLYGSEKGAHGGEKSIMAYQPDSQKFGLQARRKEGEEDKISRVNGPSIAYVPSALSEVRNAGR
jgi:hypothetical protein